MLAEKLESAGHGGEGFTSCVLYESSKEAAELVRITERKVALIVIKANQKSNYEERNCFAYKQKKDGDPPQESKNKCREHERKEKQITSRAPTPAGKTGYIISNTFMT